MRTATHERLRTTGAKRGADRRSGRTSPRSRRCGSAYLGKQGSVSALLKTLGGDERPSERQAEGPRIHALREAVTAALAARKAALEAAALEARLAAETLDLTLPAPETPARHRSIRSAR